MKDLYYPIKKCDLILSSTTFDYHVMHTTLFCIIDGTLSFDAENLLETGSVFFCFPGNTLFQIDSHCVLLRLEFDNKFFLDEIPELMVFPDKPFILDFDNHFFSMLKDYAHSRLTNTCSKFRTKALAFSLLEQLSFSSTHTSLNFNLGNTHSEQLLKEILDYIYKNMTELLSLTTVANCFSLTPQYLSVLFKKKCHITFQTYLQSLRSQKAEAYLSYTDEAVETIVYKLHLKSFQPSFPQREATSNTATTTFSVLAPDTALTYLTDFSQPDTVPSHNYQHHSIEISDSKTTLFPVWKQLINLGYAINFNNPKLFPQLIHMQNCIGFRYGRLCRIFDLVTTYSAGNKVLYDFNLIFRIFDVLINNHMYPFLELGNKRLRIQLTLRDSLVPDVPEDSEEYFQYLLKILPSFICACINRYGYASLTNWKFEVCSPNYESLETIDDFPFNKYIDFFRQIKSCIHSYVPECQVGGPGFNNWSNPDSLEQLLTYFKSASVSPDFITSYLYPLDKKNMEFVLSSDSDILEKRMKQLKRIVQNTFPECEIWVTEFNSNLSSRNYLNDSSYQATFIVHNLFAAIRCDIKAMGYYLISDIPLCYADTFDMLFGGWGLFSNNSIPKPAFHALHLFSKLGTHQIFQTDHALITNSGADPNSFECLLYHFQQLSPDYCNRNIAKDDFLHPDALFLPQMADSWEINFPSLTPGYYLIHHYTISPDQGNVLFQWYQLHFLTPDKEKNYNLIRKLSEIPQKVNCVKVSGQNTLSVRCVLSRQEIQLITIDYFHPLTEKEN